MRRRAALLLFVLSGSVPLSGCDDGGGGGGGGGGGETPFVPPDPATCAVYLWEPGDGELETWPAMEYLVADGARATGFRFSITRERHPALDAYGNFARIPEEQLSTLDGFGVNAALWAEFSRPFVAAALPPGDGETRVTDPVGIVVFDEDGAASLHPVAVGAIPDASGEARLLSAVPMRPLPERARAAFFVTTGGAPSAMDGCISPSAGMRALLDAPDEASARAIAALTELGVIETAHDLVVLQPFVTQSIYDESAAVAADIASRPDSDFALDIDPAIDCTDIGAYRHCVARLAATDYRNAAGFVELDASGAAIRHATYQLLVHVFLPDGATGPGPTLLFGHGLNGSTVDHATSFLPYTAPLGAVIVGVDALEHGDHPTSDAEGGLQRTLRFFAVELTSEGASLDALRLRDNFQQSVFDRLQVTRAILADPDLDRDGVDDADLTRLGYVGVSLGAIMGAELLALTDVFEGAVLSTPGGRVSAIVNDEESVFAPLEPALLPAAIAADPAKTEKLFGMLQTALDRGDAASFAARVLDRRFPFAPMVPNVLALVALDDDVVPNAENYAFARAMGLGIVPPVLRAAPGVVTLEGAPVAGNVAGGAATAGLLQFDQVELDGGEVTVATHGNVASSVTARAAIFPFFESTWESGVAQIIDPYEATGLAHSSP